MKIGIITNSDNLIPLSYALVSNGIQVHVFYSNSQDVVSNQNVLHFMDQAGIHYEVDSEKHLVYNWLLTNKFNVCFVLGYGKLIKLDKLKSLLTPIFNIHFGPLPSYKGPTPIFWQLKHGCDKIGLVIHRLTEKFDEGAVVWKKEIDNRPYFTYKSVEQHLSNSCIEGVFFILGMIGQGIPLLDLNVTNKPTYHPKPQLKDVAIRWNEMGSAEICNLIRACNPWNKGALTVYNGQEVKLMDGFVDEKTHPDNYAQHAGTILLTDKDLRITCVDGKLLNVSMIYMYDFYIPAYYCGVYGVKVGERFDAL